MYPLKTISMFKNNPTYQLQGEFNGLSVYTLAKETDYHLLRYIEALNWQTYANCGMTKEKMTAFIDELLRMCNEEKPRTIITDVSAIAQAMKHSMNYPFDEHCAVNIGAILSFVEWKDGKNTVSEDPNKVEPFFTRKKVELAMNNPDAYTFFLGWGVANTPEYKAHLDISTASTYFSERTEVLRTLLPEHLRTLTN